MIEVIKGGMQVLQNVSSEEMECIKKELTLDNPAYQQVKKFSRYQYTSIPPFLTFYSTVDGKIIVPRGYKIPFEHKVIRDDRVERKVLYPKFKLELRETQKEAFEAWNKDRENGMIVLQTGKGKSILGCYLAYATKQKTLVVVQKNDLVDGWMNDINLCFGLSKDKIGLIKAGKKKIGKQITIATIQTLNRLDSEEIRELYNAFGMVILDECLVGDTLIALEDGGFKYIKDVNNNDKIIGGEVSNKFKRKAKICEVTSKHSTLRGSYTHPTFILPRYKINPKVKNNFTIDDLEEVCLADIKVGDYVPILKKVPHTTKNNWSEEQLSFVALIMADGHLDKRGNRVKVNVSKDKDWYLETFTKGVKSFKDVEVKHSYDCRGNLTIWCNSKEIKDILEFTFNIPRGKKSNNLIINEQIQYAPLNSIKSFIETLFNCEGDLSITKESYRLNIGMTSKPFIQGLQHLLKKFGIITSYQEIVRGTTKHSNVYRLTIGGCDLNQFYSEFTLLNRKTPLTQNKEGFNGYDIGDYRLVRVKKVNFTEEEELVYDFTTTSHTFIANGTLTHNCHHSPAKSYNLFKFFQAKYFIGLTATDQRPDGLQDVQYWLFGNVAYRSKEDENDEDIMPYTVKIKNSSIEYNPPDEYYYGNTIVDAETAEALRRAGKKVKRKPINPQELKKLLRDRKFNELVARDIYKEYSAKKSCIAFLHEKEHIRELRDILIEFGVPREQIQLYYGDAKEDDSVMKQRAESKEVLITLATFAKATEGTNVKAWERGFLVTSINNEKNVIQAVGRCRRRKEGKEDVIIYDYAHPKVKGMRNHINTRLKAYKQNKAKIIWEDKPNNSKGTITRGWKKGR